MNARLAARLLRKPQGQSHRVIVGSLLESMNACDTTRWNQPTPYQRQASRFHMRESVRVVLCCAASLVAAAIVLIAFIFP